MWRVAVWRRANETCPVRENRYVFDDGIVEGLLPIRTGLSQTGPLEDMARAKGRILAPAVINTAQACGQRTRKSRFESGSHRPPIEGPRVHKSQNPAGGLEMFQSRSVGPHWSTRDWGRSIKRISESEGARRSSSCLYWTKIKQEPTQGRRTQTLANACFNACFCEGRRPVQGAELATAACDTMASRR